MGERFHKNQTLPFILGVVVSLAVTTVVQEETPPQKPVAAPVTSEAVGVKKDDDLLSQQTAKPHVVLAAGTQVSVDPTTGKLFPPTPAQRKSLADALRKQFTFDPYGPYYFSDGTISFVVGAKRLNFSLAHVNEKGLPEMSCVSGLEQAVSILENESQKPILRAEE